MLVGGWDLRDLWNHGGGAIHGIVFEQRERVIHLVEREGSHLGLQTNLGGDLQEIARILARHVCHAAHLPFAPQQSVLIELRNAIQMDGVNGHNAAFAQTGQRGDHDISAGSEGNRTIQLHRRFVFLTAHPCCAE